MKVGDLVRLLPGPKPTVGEGDWVGIITGFRIGAEPDDPEDRYALVFWNEQFPEEEEYLEQIEVIS